MTVEQRLESIEKNLADINIFIREGILSPGNQGNDRLINIDKRLADIERVVYNAPDKNEERLNSHRSMLTNIIPRLLKLEQSVFKTPPPSYNPAHELNPETAQKLRDLFKNALHTPKLTGPGIGVVHENGPEVLQMPDNPALRQKGTGNPVAGYVRLKDDDLPDLSGIANAHAITREGGPVPGFTNERDWEVIELGKPGTPIPRSQSLLTDEEIAAGQGDILTVKRMSDGEVFTVGKTCYLNNSSLAGNIREFRVHESGIMVVDTPNFNVAISQLRRVIKFVQRDWEVVEFRPTFSDPLLNNTYYLHDTGYSQKGCEKRWTLDQMLHDDIGSVKPGGYYIHSVRRTTDNQVFTVGDKVEGATIDRFEIIRDEMWVHGLGWMQKLFEVKKVPLFTTMDGVPIYTKSTWVFCFWPNGKVTHDAVSNINADYEHGHFSTRDAAEAAYKNWLQSQRVLTLGDALECDGDIAKLEALVKGRVS